jgi:3-phenylpropionate/cinnamic acid dioxygenase small subunit
MSTLLRVAELNAAYAATIDTAKLESWPDFFVEDCLYKITSADNHKRGHSAGVVYADSRAMLQDRVTALRTANIYERQSYRHIVGLPLIGANGADNIAAETPFLVARIMRDGRTDLFVTGVFSTGFAMKLAACASPSVLWSATAVISIRYWPFRFEATGDESQISRNGTSQC